DEGRAARQRVRLDPLLRFDGRIAGDHDVRRESRDPVRGALAVFEVSPAPDEQVALRISARDRHRFDGEAVGLGVEPLRLPLGPGIAREEEMPDLVSPMCEFPREIELERMPAIVVNCNTHTMMPPMHMRYAIGADQTSTWARRPRTPPPLDRGRGFRQPP